MIQSVFKVVLDDGLVLFLVEEEEEEEDCLVGLVVDAVTVDKNGEED